MVEEGSGENERGDGKGRKGMGGRRGGAGLEHAPIGIFESRRLWVTLLFALHTVQSPRKVNASPHPLHCLQESLADAKVSARQQCVYEGS